MAGITSITTPRAWPAEWGSISRSRWLGRRIWIMRTPTCRTLAGCIVSRSPSSSDPQSYAAFRSARLLMGARVFVGALLWLVAAVSAGRAEDVPTGPPPWRVGGPLGFTVDAASFPDSNGSALEIYLRLPPSTIATLERSEKEAVSRLRVTGAAAQSIRRLPARGDAGVHHRPGRQRGFRSRGGAALPDQERWIPDGSEAGGRLVEEARARLHRSQRRPVRHGSGRADRSRGVG